MKQLKLLIVFWIISTACAQQSNLEYTVQFLNNEISFETYMSEIDTSKKAIQDFIKESEKANTNFETRISSGPVEFDSIADTLLNKLGKSLNPRILQILSIINETVDGYISESFSVKVAYYVEIYPETYKKVIIEQGKDSWILTRFLFDKGFDYNESVIFEKMTENDSLIIEWANYQTEYYFK